MKTKNQRPKSNVMCLSIDDWQDDEPMTGSRLDNPFWSSLAVIGAVGCLFCIGALLPEASARREQFGEHREGPAAPRAMSPGSGLDEALEGLDGNFSHQSLQYLADRANFDPAKKRVVQDRIIRVLKTKPSILRDDLEVFSVWFDAEDSHRISALFTTASTLDVWCLAGAMSKLPNPVPALISQLSKHRVHGEAYMALKQELSNHNVPAAEISRQLAGKLRSVVDPQDFERIVLLLKTMSWETRDDPELKKLIAGAMASVGRNLTPDQLESMGKDVADAITTFAVLPESSDLLEKLAATSGGSKSVRMLLGGQSSEEAASIALKLAQENKVRPRELVTYRDSESVQEFLWEGKLQGKPGFFDVKMDASETSMRAFSKASVSLIESDPDAAIDSLLPVVQRHKKEITRETVSGEFLEKLDSLLVDKLSTDLRLASTKNNPRSTNRRKSPASLILAERLGGTEAALAIAKAGKKKPQVLREFEGMLNAMIALNEPETYGMIVNAWIIHGEADGLTDIGEAIEPQFISRLQVRLKKLNAKDKNQRRAIHILMGALEQIGTSKSVPVLEELTESKVAGFRKASAKALKMIRDRPKQRP